MVYHLYGQFVNQNYHTNRVLDLRLKYKWELLTCMQIKHLIKTYILRHRPIPRGGRHHSCCKSSFELHATEFQIILMNHPKKKTLLLQQIQLSCRFYNPPFTLSPTFTSYANCTDDYVRMGQQINEVALFLLKLLIIH